MKDGQGKLLGINTRWKEKKNAGIQINRLPQEGWHTVIVEVRGNSFTARIGSEKPITDKTDSLVGTLGFILPPDSAVKLRNIKVELLK